MFGRLGSVFTICILGQLVQAGGCDAIAIQLNYNSNTIVIQLYKSIVPDLGEAEQRTNKRGAFTLRV